MTLKLSLIRILGLLSAFVFSTVLIIGNLDYLKIKESQLKEEQLALTTEAGFLLREIRYHIVQIQQFITDASLTKEQGSIDEANDNLKQSKVKIDQLKKVIPGKASAISEINSDVDALYKSGINMYEAYTQTGVEAGNKLMIGPGGFDESSSILADHLDELAIEQAKNYQQGYIEKQTSDQQQSTLLLVSAIVILFVIGASVVILYLNIIPALTRLNNRMLDISKGGRNLSKRIRPEGIVEIRLVANNFNSIMSAFDEIVSSARYGAEKMHHRSRSLIEASKKNFNNINEVNMNAEQVATAINEMAATVQEIALNTELAYTSSNNAKQSVIEGQSTVEKTKVEITNLAEQVKSASIAINQLSKDSEQIGAILAVIRSISDQTNLLALNAAIEAARAGEHGRGFAVVADEVRTLAQRTQDSTTEIQQMIERIQSGTQSATEVMESGQRQAEKTVERAQETSNALAEILTAVEAINEMNTQVATASEQQSAVAREVNENIVQVANIARNAMEVAQVNGITALEVSYGSEEVSGLMSQFIVSFEAPKDKEAVVEWSDAYLVNVSEMDKQHKKLFDLINVAMRNARADLTSDGSQRSMNELVKSALDHLADEEALLKKIDYADFKEHLKSHDKLRNDITNYLNQYKSGDRHKMVEVILYLKLWLVDHIYRQDKQYSVDMNKAGIK
jgi:methyl-accepting chemotaxis protein